MLRQLPIEYHAFASLQNRAYHIANQIRQSPYDCLYLVLAAILDGRMVTADRRFYDRIVKSPFAAHVRWVEDVEQPKPSA